MTALERPPRAASSASLAPLYAALRARLALVALLFGAAALGWVWTAREMRGMDNGPWSDLGGFGWFVGVWLVMMAAMMFPSVAPTVALYSRMTKQRSPVSPFAFVAGYLLTWAVAGVAAYGVAAAATRLDGGQLSWSNAGRPIAGATLLVAAVYELAKNGAWCGGCCWALMASLFALGVMSVSWMALVAGLIAVEKTLPWRRIVTYGTAAVLLVLGVLVLAAPHALPGLTIPTGHMSM
jgi:predicted metal-binding membrane protein